MSSRAGSGRWFDVVNQAGEIKRPSEERDRVWIIADGKCAGVDISCLVEFVLFGIGLWLKNRRWKARKCEKFAVRRRGVRKTDSTFEAGSHQSRGGKIRYVV